jgi:hypothetical protein
VCDAGVCKVATDGCPAGERCCTGFGCVGSAQACPVMVQ